MSLNKRKIARIYSSLNRRFENKWFKQISSSLNEVGNEVARMVQALGPETTMLRLHTELINTGITDEVNALWKEVGLFWANRTYRSLAQEPEVKAAPLGFSAEWTRMIQDELRIFLIEKVLFKASDSTKQMLLRVISEGIEQGWSVQRIVDELTDYPGLEYQAARIVRTEVNRAANLGVETGGKTFPYEQNKVWISVHDFRTRGQNPDDHADHFRMDGQTVPFNSKFTDPRNGHQLDYPGDAKAPPGDTVNCRCTMGLVGQRDERGRLIPKQSRISVIREFNREQRTITI
jgi:hypothetical protein